MPFTPSIVLLNDVAQVLVTQGLGQISNDKTDWMIYKGYLQGQPDRAICLYETAGLEPEAAVALDHPGLQVRIRGNPNDYQVIRERMRLIFLALQNQDGLLNAANGTSPAPYVTCFARQGIIPMGQDENRRPQIVQNWKITVRRDQTSP